MGDNRRVQGEKERRRGSNVRVGPKKWREMEDNGRVQGGEKGSRRGSNVRLGAKKGKEVASGGCEI